MSYALSAALQEAVYASLSQDTTLSELVGGAIYDAAPPGRLPALYVTLGPETVRDASDQIHAGARHDLRVSVVSDEAGFLGAKTVAARISDVLHRAPLTLTRGTLVGLWFWRADARRTNDGSRRIDLIFRARVDDT
ncbi:MAG: DUF3168 domain-containing protein [Paracoccaceae bacterium]